MTFSTELLRHCWFLAGPTACGKTALSLALAERLDAEIVALDSMTLYRGMDIGTAKASLAERSQVRHHLIDVLDHHDEFSLAEYLAAAETCCREIVDRGRTPLFVGGSGLYLRGVLRGVFQGPEADWILRRQLEERAAREGSESLHRELAQVDPLAALRLHPNDLRRIVRAIEVHRLTGRPLSEQQIQHPMPLTERTPHVYWLSPPRDWLYARINARVEQMFQQGLLAEVRGLMELPHSLSHTARQALGYKEVIDWIEADRMTPGHGQGASRNQPDELLQLIQTRTRQFAKRQQTWFRNLEELAA
ncbi:MAG: tRNA (adenosine(37)-N6)-dimethylallyltransferase MiaA, partial [Candidatus Saccharimonas sp.]|nr:tRNA (adenosine(37)-N6)-dimethylallyltransferase MiaA [Planctomycetaceae bacterium]